MCTNENEYDYFEYRSLPAWICENNPILKKIEVNRKGAMRTIKDRVYIWSPKENCHEFGYMQMDCYKGDKKRPGWWLAKSDEGWFLRPCNWRSDNPGQKEGHGGKYKWSKRTQIPLQRIVAAAWVPREEGQDCVIFKDGDKFNTDAGNLMWVSRREINAGKKYKEGKRKYEWEERFDTMTPKEIYEDFKSRGINISMMTVYKYKKEHCGELRKDRDDEILAMYDPDLTQKENVEIMRAAGFRISQPKLSLLLKYKYKG